MTKPGLSIEAAASIMARDLIQQHLARFQFVIRGDRATGQQVVAAYIDGLSGAMALVIAGGKASKEEVTKQVEKKLAESLVRDLGHMKAT